jgi:hypothetical protein
VTRTDQTHHASRPNPALKAFGVLVGEWSTVGTHPLVPGKTFHGHTSFEWIEGGAFLVMHSQIQEPDIPNAVAIFGSDDATGECFMLYFDERQVSRKYVVSLKNNVWKWWRNSPEFSQRFTGIIADDHRTIKGTGELSRDGKPWEGDLSLTYTKIS